ncbi:Fic family protein [Arcticibacterium luteifluviistationis]|uniref:Fic family protein n=1 Tax=Arcticibacterium luteifluviistationis TaxID=1784714 RepID=UPI0013A6B6C2|nr:Fic family protein [Arcticibacterium luteifluviistationis]
MCFEIIHLYEDGNGRIGRALAEKVLSERPGLTAIAHAIEVNKKKYYDALHKSNHSLDITKWLVFFSEIILEAQAYILSLIDFVIAKTNFFEKHKNILNERQKKAVLRMFKEGIEGFQGGLSAELYAYYGTSRATTTRDLANLIEKTVFKKTGELKSSRCFLILS